MKRLVLSVLAFSFVLGALTGCAGTALPPQIYPVPKEEPEWIVQGGPIEFEGEMWYPRDYVDILLDTEVIPTGEYKGVSFFVERIDVRPYDRLYTKFGINKYRVFTKQNDKSKKSL